MAESGRQVTVTTVPSAQLIVALKLATVTPGLASVKVATVPLNTVPSTAEMAPTPVTTGAGVNVSKTARPPLAVSPTNSDPSGKKPLLSPSVGSGKEPWMDVSWAIAPPLP